MQLVTFGRACFMLGFSDSEFASLRNYYSFVLNNGKELTNKQVSGVLLSYLYEHQDLPTYLNENSQTPCVLQLFTKEEEPFGASFTGVDMFFILLSDGAIHDRGVINALKGCLQGKYDEEIEHVTKDFKFKTEDPYVVDSKYFSSGRCTLWDMIIDNKEKGLIAPTRELQEPSFEIEYMELQHILDYLYSYCRDGGFSKKVHVLILRQLKKHFEEGIENVKRYFNEGWYFNKIHDLAEKDQFNDTLVTSFGEFLRVVKNAVESKEDIVEPIIKESKTVGTMTKELNKEFSPEEGYFHYTTVSLDFVEINSLVQLYSLVVASSEDNVKYSVLLTNRAEKMFRLVVCFKGTDRRTEQELGEALTVYEELYTTLTYVREKLGQEVLSERHVGVGDYTVVTDNVQNLIDTVL